MAAEYGLAVSYADAKAWSKNRELDANELSQVASGGKGVGVTICDGLGRGLGTGAGSDGHGWFYACVCVLLGIGQGETDCLGEGVVK